MVPSGWATAQLAAFADVKLGKMLSPKAHRPGLVRLRYLRNENVRWGRVDTGDVKEMGFKPEEIDRYAVQPGDLLVCEGGEPGRAAVFRGHCPVAFQKALHRVRPIGGLVSTSLLRYFLEHLAKSGSLVPKIAQTTIQHLPLERFEVVEFPIPPQREQERIVAAVEEALSRLDAGVEALERVKRLLSRYRASVLKAACEGRLVPTEAALARAEGRSFEPASELLARILVERRARWDRQTNYTEPTPPDTSSLPALPQGWVWATLGQLSWQSGYGTSLKCDYGGAGYPVLRIPNISGARLDLSDLKRVFRAGDVFESNDLVGPGDLLIVRTNGSRDLIGRAAIVETPLGTECSFASYLIRFRLCGEPTCWRFVSLAWRTPGNRRDLESRAATSAGQYNISQRGLAAVAVPLPPFAEQRRIVGELERRLSIADEAEVTVDSALARAARLRQSVLKRAFEGRLVPQDPNDEPASVLLASIRAERERAATDRKPKRRTRRKANR